MAYQVGVDEEAKKIAVKPTKQVDLTGKLVSEDEQRVCPLIMAKCMKSKCLFFSVKLDQCGVKSAIVALFRLAYPEDLVHEY